ncbi:50S ribosomal protein L23 [Candidatus Berkelbacteria bacterium]|nr:50S ribosomal protein L23 [Candidatus Berkelbacteria bacterium]
MSHLIRYQPVVSEKSLAGTTAHKYTFMISAGTNKLALAAAIEDAYKVHVVSVNILKLPAKRKARGVQGRSIKAIVTLKAGERIKGFEIPSPTQDSSAESEKTKK